MLSIECINGMWELYLYTQNMSHCGVYMLTIFFNDIVELLYHIHLYIINNYILCNLKIIQWILYLNIQYFLKYNLLKNII